MCGSIVMYSCTIAVFVIGASDSTRGRIAANSAVNSRVLSAATIRRTSKFACSIDSSTFRMGCGTPSSSSTSCVMEESGVKASVTSSISSTSITCSGKRTVWQRLMKGMM